MYAEAPVLSASFAGRPAGPSLGPAVEREHEVGGRRADRRGVRLPRGEVRGLQVVGEPAVGEDDPRVVAEMFRRTGIVGVERPQTRGHGAHLGVVDRPALGPCPCQRCQAVRVT